MTRTLAPRRPGTPPGPVEPRQRIELQQGRLIAALLDSVAEHGYAAINVGTVIRRAHVSSRTFYDHFEDREACFLAAFDHTVLRARSLASDAYRQQPGWLEGTRAALLCLLVLMEEEPRLGRLCLIEAAAAGPRVRKRRSQVLAELAGAIDRARDAASEHDPPRLAGQALAGGIAAVLAERLLAPRREPLTDLLGQLMSMIALTYMGAEAARAELSAPRPTVARRTAAPAPEGSDPGPLESLNLRLTYRTSRVLAAIAKQPGASNRDVAAAAGILDQGQVSKLLARLARLGLIENSGAGQRHGTANAWRLTELGGQLEKATRPS
jgi:AcrR family transcriptional regulator